MSLKEFFGIALRGMAMGAADVVPGVSGGTIAYITGIYSRLIASLTSFDTELVRLVLKLKIVAAWKHVDANFLAALFVGVVTSIFLFAHLISYLLETVPLLVWGFFLGLILISAISMLLKMTDRKLLDVVPLVIGAVVIFAIAESPAASLSPELPWIFMAGFVAISAMLLPGVSGSFLLLLVGLYEPTIEAVKTLNVAYILTFAAGAACGFLVFSRFIKWLLHRFYRQTLLFLIGLLCGSVYVVWPWKLVNGDFSQHLSVSAYKNQVGDPMLTWTFLSFCAGVLVIVLFEFFVSRNSPANRE